MPLRKIFLPARVNRNALVERMHEINSFIQESGLVSATLNFDKDEYSIHGKTKNGRNILIKIRENEIYSEKTVIVSKKMTPEQRATEAKKMRKLGLTQEKIAIRLGVTQKTISLDLSK